MGGSLEQSAKKRKSSALTGLEALLRLVDDVDAALAAHETVVAVAIAQGLERIADFHGFTRSKTLREEPRVDDFRAPMPDSSLTIKCEKQELGVSIGSLVENRQPLGQGDLHLGVLLDDDERAKTEPAAANETR
jgi:hypothetical protein